MLKPYLVIFYGVELIPVHGKKVKTQKRRFEQFITDFPNYDRAKEWAKENIDAYLYGDHEWLPGSRIYEVSSVAEISSHKRLMDSMSQEAISKIQTNLEKIVLDFMSEKFESEYLWLLNFSQKDKTFKNPRDKIVDSAKYMANFVKRNCEHELSFHFTFHGANIHEKVQTILELYFINRSETPEKSIGASQ